MLPTLTRKPDKRVRVYFLLRVRTRPRIARVSRAVGQSRDATAIRFQCHGGCGLLCIHRTSSMSLQMVDGTRSNSSSGFRFTSPVPSRSRRSNSSDPHTPTTLLRNFAPQISALLRPTVGHRSGTMEREAQKRTWAKRKPSWPGSALRISECASGQREAAESTPSPPS